jgi:hypothetical protein
MSTIPSGPAGVGDGVAVGVVVGARVGVEVKVAGTGVAVTTITTAVGGRGLFVALVVWITGTGVGEVTTAIWADVGELSAATGDICGERTNKATSATNKSIIKPITPPNTIGIIEFDLPFAVLSVPIGGGVTGLPAIALRKAATISLALWKRSSRRLASALSTTLSTAGGTAAFNARSAGGALWT